MNADILNIVKGN